MNYKFTQRNIAPIDCDEAFRVGKKMGLHPKIAELLFSRGFCDEASIDKFLHPDPSDFNGS